MNTPDVTEKPEAPTPVACSAWLGDIERAINHAYESGYISGHNDTCEGCFNEDTAFVAKDRAAEIVRVITAHMSPNNAISESSALKPL